MLSVCIDVRYVPSSTTCTVLISGCMRTVPVEKHSAFWFALLHRSQIRQQKTRFSLCERITMPAKKRAVILPSIFRCMYFSPRQVWPKRRSISIVEQEHLSGILFLLFSTGSRLLCDVWWQKTVWFGHTMLTFGWYHAANPASRRINVSISCLNVSPESA